jgi:hypothetical protein
MDRTHDLGLFFVVNPKCQNTRWIELTTLSCFFMGEPKFQKEGLSMGGTKVSKSYLEDQTTPINVHHDYDV